MFKDCRMLHVLGYNCDNPRRITNDVTHKENYYCNKRRQKNTLTHASKTTNKSNLKKWHQFTTGQLSFMYMKNIINHWKPCFISKPTSRNKHIIPFSKLRKCYGILNKISSRTLNLLLFIIFSQKTNNRKDVTHKRLNFPYNITDRVRRLVIRRKFNRSYSK